jgi:hypothetical protein
MLDSVQVVAVVAQQRCALHAALLRVGDIEQIDTG